MRKAIASLAREMVPAGMLSDTDLDGIAANAAANIARAPWYFRMALRLFFVVCATAHLAPGRVIAWMLSVRRPRMLMRVLGWTVLGVQFPVHLETYSHPKVLARLGVDEGRSWQPDAKPQPHPSPVEATSLADMRDDALVADIVIVGSGPGGAIAALELARSGYSVIVCEQGRPSSAATTADAASAARNHFAYGGNLVACGRGPMFVPLLAGAMLGGSAAINAGTCLLPSDEKFREWGFDPAGIRACADEIRELYGIAIADSSIMGRQNFVMQHGCAKIGIRTDAIPRNAANRDDIAAVSVIGGAKAYKLSPDRSLLRQAALAGTRVIIGCHVLRVDIRHGRAVGLLAHDDKRRRRIDARKSVIIAAGALQTPLLLRKSGIRHPGIGRASFFQLNTNVIGLMRETVNGHLGIEQGIVSRQFERDGLVYEAVSTPVALTVPYMPGFGVAQFDQLRAFPRMAQQGVIIDADKTPLTIRGLLGAPLITFDLHDDDAARVRDGLATCVRILEAAGAERFLVPGAKQWHDSAVAALADIQALHQSDLHLASVHPIGTCPMGDDPSCPIDRNGAVRGTRRLHVIDGSIIPTSTGVNPQVAILAIGLHLARQLATQLRPVIL